MSRLGQVFCGLLAVLPLVLNGKPAAAVSYHAIQVPNSTQTAVQGINNLNQIVGWYNDQTGQTHGFLLSNGKYTAVDFGPADETFANGINDAGVMVGFYQTPPPYLSAPRGWIDQNGRFTEIDYPGAAATLPQAINKGGEVVGYFIDGAGNYLAFTYVNGKFSPLVIPAATWSFAEGIDANGDISGYYWTPLNGGLAEHGFILRANGRLEIVEDPAQPNATLLTGMNDKLQAAGSYDISNTSDFSGFGFARGQFVAVNYPGAISTTPNAINNSDVVVGTWYPAGPEQDIPHGFYALP